MLTSLEGGGQSRRLHVQGEHLSQRLNLGFQGSSVTRQFRSDALKPPSRLCLDSASLLRSGVLGIHLFQRCLSFLNGSCPSLLEGLTGPTSLVLRAARSIESATFCEGVLFVVLRRPFLPAFFEGLSTTSSRLLMKSKASVRSFTASALRPQLDEKKLGLLPYGSRRS